mgnify:CR=1 FL=1
MKFITINALFLFSLFAAGPGGAQVISEPEVPIVVELDFIQDHATVFEAAKRVRDIIDEIHNAADMSLEVEGRALHQELVRLSDEITPELLGMISAAPQIKNTHDIFCGPKK